MFGTSNVLSNCCSKMSDQGNGKSRKRPSSKASAAASKARAKKAAQKHSDSDSDDSTINNPIQEPIPILEPDMPDAKLPEVNYYLYYIKYFWERFVIFISETNKIADNSKCQSKQHFHVSCILLVLDTRI